MRSYNRLNLADLYLGLEDLFTKRHAALLTTKAGAGHEEVLAVQRQEISNLPTAMTGGRAFADELATLDDDYDGYGYGLWHLTEAHLRVPGSNPEVAGAALRVREAFVPELSTLNASYADEAAAAAGRKEKLVELEGDLKKLPTGEGSAYDWAAAFVATGNKLGELLGKRADAESQTRKNAQVLRSETIGILNDLRRAVTREKRRNASLPGDIDTQIFGYLDLLEDNRQKAARGNKPKSNESE